MPVQDEEDISLMFSQFRNAVEQLEQLASQQISNTGRRPANSSGSTSSQTSSVETFRSPKNSMDESRRSTSMSSPTPSQLAESALSNFRKTLMASRSGSPAPPPHLPDKDPSIQSRVGRTLEERLRASFTIGEASERTTPEPSKVATPAESNVDPAAIQLPHSPVLQAARSSLDGAQSEGEVIEEIMPQETNRQRGVSASTAETKDAPTDPLPGLSHDEKGTSDTNVDNIPIERTKSPDTFSEPLAIVDNDVPGDNTSNTPTLGVTETMDGAKDDGSVSVQELTEGSVSNYQSLPVSPQYSASATSEENSEIEQLRERLKLVEQRFADISISFKRIQAEKFAADQVLKSHTPVESISDADGLRDHLKNLQLKVDASTDEIKMLNRKAQLYDERLQDIRDTHRLESSSQSEQIDKLRSRLSETDTLVKAKTDEISRHKADLNKAHGELEKAKSALKDEEEKGSKAISLLKTVRSKLVKAERERDEALKEVNSSKDKIKEEVEKEKQERVRLEQELNRLRGDKDREVAALKNQSEKEINNLKDKHDREMAARKSQYELEAITTKATHTKELSAKASRITVLETSLRIITEEKDSLFDQLQLRQAELESSQSHLDSLEARCSELQHQLREAEARTELLMDELTESRNKASNGDPSHTSAEELARILSETENRYELRLSEVRGRVRGLEKERQEAEDEWSRNLQERGRELERLRGLLDSKDKEYSEFLRTKADMQNRIGELQTENRKLQLQKQAEDGILAGLQNDIQWLKESQVSLTQEKEDAAIRSQSFEKLLEEAKSREQALKVSNKTLRDELRKVQASATLLEKNRNPGVGYWSTMRNNGFTQSAVDLQLQSPKSPTQASRTSIDEGSVTSTRPGSPTPKSSDEEVNLEYVRNVILQFLEHKEMRPNLVRVLSIILHFTPQETRRLIAKV